MLVSAEIVLDLPENDPATAPLRDAYLRVWTAYDSFENVLASFRLAHRLSALVSALSWYSGIVEMTEDVRTNYAHVVPELLKEFMNAEMNRYPFV